MHMSVHKLMTHHVLLTGGQGPDGQDTEGSMQAWGPNAWNVVQLSSSSPLMCKLSKLLHGSKPEFLLGNTDVIDCATQCGWPPRSAWARTFLNPWLDEF